MNTTTKVELTPEQKAAKRQEFIDGLAEDLKETVQKIESKPATTQHHYGDYGALISQLALGNKILANILGEACIVAGANPVGVANGVKLFV
jgi:hypothetical protein